LCVSEDGLKGDLNVCLSEYESEENDYL